MGVLDAKSLRDDIIATLIATDMDLETSDTWIGYSNSLRWRKPSTSFSTIRSIGLLH